MSNIKTNLKSDNMIVDKKSQTLNKSGRKSVIPESTTFIFKANPMPDFYKVSIVIGLLL